MRLCPHCDAPSEVTFRFCPACGSRLPRRRQNLHDIPARGGGQTDVAPPSSARSQARKHVTALFCDLTGSTELIADSDPEEAQAHLDTALRVMTSGVMSFGGTLVQVLGDGLFAVFGAPIAQEDHALRACMAAQAILSGASKAAAPDVMRIRIGLDSGEIVFGSVDGAIGANYRADGATIHLAARLEQLARAGTALMSEATFRLLQGRIATRNLGPQVIRGFKARIDLHEMAGEGFGQKTPPAPSKSAIEPMVGRDKILASLIQTATNVRIGKRRAAAIGLLGEPGIGKSRLIAELRSRLDAAGFESHAAYARSFAGNVAYSLIADMLRAFMGVSHRLDVSGMRDAARDAIAGLPREFSDHLAAVTDLLDLGDPGPTWQSLHPQQRRRAISKALAWFAARRLSATPLLLIVEDIHLADNDSIRILDAVLHQFVDQPLVFCASYRPGFEFQRKNPTAISEVSVGPLTIAQMEGLAQTILGTDSSLSPLLPALLDRADGNPFFLEQLILNLVDEGKLQGERGNYHLVGKTGRWRVPGSIASVIGTRVDHLPIQSKAAVEAAAVLGEQITPDLIATMLGGSREQSLEALASAVDAGLMTRPAEGESTYAFTHSLVREAVGASLTRQSLRDLHRQACKGLLAQHAGAIDEVAPLVLQHAYDGESWIETIDFAMPAMSRAIARSANREALRIFEIGLRAAERMPDDRAMTRRELALRIKALSALLPLNRIDEILSNLGHAERLANTLGDHRRLAVMRVQLAVIQWTMGKYGEGLESAQMAATAAILAHDRSLEMAAAQSQLMLLHATGRYMDAVAAARRISRRFAPELARHELIPGWAIIASVAVRVFLADSLARLGRFSSAQRALDASYRELAHHQHAFSRVLTDFIQACAWIESRRFGEAAELLATAAETCRVHDLTTMYPPVIASLGGALARSGRLEEGLTLLQQATRDGINTQGGRYNEVYLPANLGIALSLAERHTEALESARRAVAASVDFGQIGHKADALLLQGEAEVRAGDRAAALKSFEEGRRAALQCGMNPAERRAAAWLRQLKKRTSAKPRTARKMTRA